MTYTVKNGTWCKDNEKEYYSTTKTGLKAALKAGEIPAGTKVVVHDPMYHAGQLIQSLNPNCPEGCFVPDGSAFDTDIYTDLAAIFTDGNLPDLRECVLVMAGQNEHITTHAHDVFAAGEFKDDQAQLLTHTHGVTDHGHVHSVIDPGHVHSITDPGHVHEIRTSSEGSEGNTNDIGGDDTSRPQTEPAVTGIIIDSAMTGITIDSATTGISIDGTGTTDVTRTKQFGVYYYIAF